MSHNHEGDFDDQMKDDSMTPETVSTPPPLTPKDSLSVEVEGIRKWDALKIPQVQRLLSIVEDLQAQLRRKDEALEKLSKLGNGELCGNSVGNQIALDALADGKEGGR